MALVVEWSVMRDAEERIRAPSRKMIGMDVHHAMVRVWTPAGVAVSVSVPVGCSFVTKNPAITGVPFYTQRGYPTEHARQGRAESDVFAARETISVGCCNAMTRRTVRRQVFPTGPAMAEPAHRGCGDAQGLGLQHFIGQRNQCSQRFAFCKSCCHGVNTRIESGYGISKRRVQNNWGIRKEFS